MPLKICIADLWFRPFEFYEPALAHLGEYKLIDWRGASEVADCDVLLLADEFWPETAVALPLYHQKGIPSLHLLDGVLEWRNLFDNPRSKVEAGGMPLFQPLLSTRIGCLGCWQRELLGMLGSERRVIVTGSPRLDPLLKHKWRSLSVVGTKQFTMMVSVAKTPGFTSWQQEKVITALRDIYDSARKIKLGNNRQIQIRWRITDELAIELGWDSTWGEKASGSLRDELDGADAVISTPSTLILEAMIAKRPVAMIDYTGVPKLIHTAWTISSAAQIEDVIASMDCPAVERMAYQEFLLHKQLDCSQPSGPRVAKLIHELAEMGRRARTEGKPLSDIEKTLEVDSEIESGINKMALHDWHPNHGIFYRESIDQLQAEVMNLRRVMLMDKAAADRRISDLISRRKTEATNVSGINSCRRFIGRCLRFLSRTIDKS